MVSIIIPIFNREKTIKKCVNSVLEQSFTELEIILVNDGSSDESGVICEEYAKSDNRVKVFHIENSGVAYARNYGISHSNGDYIAFVDSDDYLSKDYIYKLVSAIDDSDYIMSICNYTEVVDIAEYERILYQSSSYTSDQYINDILYCRVQGGLCWGKLYKKELIKQNFKNFSYCEDVLFVFDYLSNNNGLIAIVADPLYYYVRHKSSITGAKKAIDLKDAVSVAEDIFDKCKMNFKNFIKPSQAFVVNNSLFAYLQNVEEKSEDADKLRIRIKKLVSTNRFNVLSDKNATVKSKGACILSLFSYRLLAFLYRFVN